MRVKTAYFQVGFAFLLGAALYPPIINIAPRIEGMINPVVLYPASLHMVLEETSIKTRIAGRARKLRDCDFRSLRWFFGTRESGRAAGVQVEFLEPPKDRGEGWFSFGPWLVQVPIDHLTNNSYATAYHQCYLYRHEVSKGADGKPVYGWPVIPMPWLTQSPFYN